MELVTQSNDNEDEVGKKGFLALPFNEEQFTTFITSLLGKQQNIEQSFFVSYELYLADLLRFYEVIHERISQQNNFRCIQILSTFFFSDNSKTTLNTIDELRIFKEVRSARTVGVVLSFVYLIHFNDKQAPERQAIDITFGSVSNDEEPKKYISSKGKTAEVSVNYTVKSWGVDIMQLLINNVKEITTERSKIANWFRQWSESIAVIGGICFFLTSLIGIFIVNVGIVSANKQAVVDLSASGTGEKFDFVLQQLAYQGIYELRTIVYIIICLVASIFFGAFMETKAYPKKDCFIIITKTDKDSLDNFNKNEKRQLLWVVLSTLGALAINVAGCYLYQYLSTM